MTGSPTYVVAVDKLDSRARISQVQVLGRYAGHLYWSGRRDEAIAPYKQAIDVATQLVKESPKNGGFLSRGGNVASLLGCLYVELGKMDSAREVLETAIGWLKDPARQVGGKGEFLADAEKCLAKVRAQRP